MSRWRNHEDCYSKYSVPMFTIQRPSWISVIENSRKFKFWARLKQEAIDFKRKAKRRKFLTRTSWKPQTWSKEITKIYNGSTPRPRSGTHRSQDILALFKAMNSEKPYPVLYGLRRFCGSDLLIDLVFCVLIGGKKGSYQNRSR